MIDILVQQHGTDLEPATYARGTQRIDYILTTPQISDYITAAGILPLNEFCYSDHRALFADIDLNRYLQGTPSKNALSQPRGIRGGDPRAVKTYRAELLKQLSDTNLEEHIRNMDKLINEHDGPLTETIIKRINELDDILTTIKLNAERKSQKQNNTPWSPTLIQSKKEKYFWELWRSEINLNANAREHNKPERSFAPQRLELWERGSTEQLTKKEVQKALRLAQQMVMEHTMNAKQLQEAHLEQCCITAVQEVKSHEGEIRRIIHTERMRSTYSKLRRVLGKNRSGGISHILVEGDTPDTWQAINDKETIDQVMDFTNMDLTEATKAILSHMRYITNTQIDDTIAAADVRGAYKAWRESTSTSPSGIHLGHDKALFRTEPKIQPTTGNTAGDATEPTEPPLSDRMFEIKATMINWAIAQGHVYPRWTRVTNTLIEKLSSINYE